MKMVGVGQGREETTHNPAMICATRGPSLTVSTSTATLELVSSRRDQRLIGVTKRTWHVVDDEIDADLALKESVCVSLGNPDTVLQRGCAALYVRLVLIEAGQLTI